MADLDEDAVWREDDWEPSEYPCMACGAEAETRGWWDDPPSLGGACIGSLYRCTICDWTDDR